MDRQVDRDRTINGVWCPRQVGRQLGWYGLAVQCWFVAGAADEGSNGWIWKQKGKRNRESY
jgi:hypothetical protein